MPFIAVLEITKVMNYKHKAVRDLLNLCLRGRKRHEVRTHEFILNDFHKNYLFGIRTPVIPLRPPPPNDCWHARQLRASQMCRQN